MDGESLILVVDDDPQNIQILGTLLRNEKYQVSIAMSGQQALERVRHSSPDLILLDVLMPDMDGVETCNKLKEDESSRDIPVIFLTALTDVKDINQGFDAGGVDYVTKPFNAAELLRRVETQLKLYKTSRELALLKNKFKT
jgi:CheY-like chemotaxis protein